MNHLVAELRQIIGRYAPLGGKGKCSRCAATRLAARAASGSRIPPGYVTPQKSSPAEDLRRFLRRRGGLSRRTTPRSPDLDTDLGTSKDPAWANRRRLLRGRERLSDQQYTRMWEEILAQEQTGELLATWIAKEELRYLLALARSHPARSEVSNRLFAFCDWCARADVPEVTTLARTIEAWWPQILAFIDTGITNASTEANNRLIKDAARIAFGFRNLDNQRRRVRLHCKRTTIISQPLRG